MKPASVGMSHGTGVGTVPTWWRRMTLIVGLTLLAGLHTVPAAALTRSYHTEAGGGWTCGAATVGMTGILTAEAGYVCADDSLFLDFFEGVAATWVLAEPYAGSTLVRGGELALSLVEEGGDNDIRLELAWTPDGATFTTLGYADANISGTGVATIDLGGISGVVPPGGRLALRVLSLASDLTLHFGTADAPAGSIRFTVNEEVACSDPVRDLAVVSSSGTAVELAWSPAYQADTYYVYRDGILEPLTTVAEPRFTDAGVVGQSGYSYEIRGYSAVSDCQSPGAFLAVTTPPFSCDLPSFDYGEVLAPGSSPQVFTLTNRRPVGTARVASLALSGSEAARFAVTADGCTGLDLAPAASCSFTVTFTPDREGDREALLTVTPAGAAPAPLNIPLRGGLRMGPTLVTDLRPGPGSSRPAEMKALPSGSFLFTADDGIHHTEPWVSDGTAAGTRILKDINPGWRSAPYGFTWSGSTMFFVADDGVNGAELWKTDGTPSGTRLVRDILPGSAGSNPANLTDGGKGAIFFTANGGRSGVELWKSDGTSAGTRMVKDIVAGSGSSSPSNLVMQYDVYNSVLYFIVQGKDLWRSDGTLAGTTLVKTLTAAQNLYNAHGMLYFAGDDGTTGLELWRSTGTPAGTVLVRDIYAGATGSTPINLTSVGSTLYFAAYTLSGRELWKSNGTVAGTVIVKDINPGSGHSAPTSLTAFGTSLIFWANDGVNGTEPWKSDGTSAGTVLIRNIYPAAGSSGSGTFTRLGEKLYFTASDGANGSELWTTDGTSAGTFAVRDANGAASSSPSNLIVSGNVLYFRAQDSASGAELWKYVPNTAPLATSIANQTGYAGETLGPLAFTVSDTQSDPADLTVTAVSNNQTLLPNANIIVGGSGASRTLLLTPAAGQRGTATVSYTVSDGVYSSTYGFQVSFYSVLPVCASGCAYGTIQAAIDASLSNDIVLVADGTYTGTGNVNLDFQNKAITVRSENGAAVTAIDCEGTADSAALFDGGEGAATVLEGFTILHARNGAVRVSASSSPTIRDCVFAQNTSATSYAGAAVWIDTTSSPTVTGCSFIDNSTSRGGAIAQTTCEMCPLGTPHILSSFFSGNTANEGGAIRIYQGEISDCVFSANNADRGGALLAGGDVTVKRCTFTGNRAAGLGGALGGSLTLLSDSAFIGNTASEGGGLQLSNGNVVNITVRDNEAATFGGGLYAGSGTVNVSNSIFWGNSTHGEGSQIGVGSSANALALLNCDLEGGTAAVATRFSGSFTFSGVNLAADPRFLAAGDAHLRADSPCIDAGSGSPIGGLSALDIDGNTRLFDGDGNGSASADIGAHEFQSFSDAPFPVIAPVNLVFNAVDGDTVPDPRYVTIANLGAVTLAWKVSGGPGWLRVDPPEGDTTGEMDTIGFYVDHGSLGRGVYTGSVQIVDPNSGTVYRTVSVALVVTGVLRATLTPAAGEYGTIQAALDAASSGDVVIVADGVYSDAGDRDLDMRGKAIELRSENGPATTIIDCLGLGRGVNFHSGESPASILQGFTIRNGNAGAGAYGGGVMISAGSPRIVDCRFESNTATYGGALWFSSDFSTVSNCTFTGNTATNSGGAVYTGYAGNLSFNKCTFSSNNAQYGGAIYTSKYPVQIDECTFTSNQATSDGGAIYITSRTVSSADTAENAIRNCTFKNNRALRAGGGIYSRDAYMVVANSVFQANRACSFMPAYPPMCSLGATTENGGGIRLDNGGTVLNSTFYDNQAGNLGGGVWTDDGSSDVGSKIKNCIFSDNESRASTAWEDIYDLATNAAASLTYSALKYSVNPTALNGGRGNRNLDSSSYPLEFVDAAAGDFRLRVHSDCCIDKGAVIDWLFSDNRGSVRAVDADNDGIPEFDIGALEYSAFFGTGLIPGEDRTTKAFKDVRINGSLIATGFEYRVEWRDRDPFPYDPRIRQSQEYTVRLSLVSAGGLRVSLGEWSLPVSQIGYTIPYTFGQDHIGRWKIRVELATDPNQYAETGYVDIQYKQVQTYLMGQWIAPPRDADPAVKPDWSNARACYWSTDTNRLYAVGPYTTVVTWYADTDRTVAIPTVAFITYPEPQIHVPETPTVRVLPQGTRFESATLVWTENDAQINGTDFNATLEGWSTILYRDTQGVTPEEREVFEVVRTLSWDHYNPLLTADPVFPIERTWDIGKLVSDPCPVGTPPDECRNFHDQTGCGSGYVFFEMAYYDGAGDNKAYDRQRRSGRIFAVNEDDPATEADDLVVVWYQKSKVADGCWPFKPVRYDPVWPAGTSVCDTGNFDSCDKIVIASQQGSGPLPPSVYGTQEKMLIYDQRDRRLPGHNPNEEHAMLFAAQGFQYPAAFALRVDLNRTNRSLPNYTSKPCVLVKYVEPGSGEWNMRAFMVTTEVAPNLTFSYPGTAGNEINPPYPLNQMVFGPCEASATITPDEVHRDKDKKFFAKAGPISGSPVWGDGLPYMPVTLRYFYRLQPSMHLDRDDNGVQDAAPSTCIPWLDYADGIPVNTDYRIHWPADVPTLFVGETLTDAKTQPNEPVGLPNIKDQCVARILYDQSNAESPGKRAAKLIDPLKEYGIPLNPQAFAGMRTNRGPDGRIMFIDLPYHIQMRLTYDEVETGGPPDFFGKLKLRGKYVAGTGEAMLLLNALTERDLRVIEEVSAGYLSNPASFLAAVDQLVGLSEPGLDGYTNLKEAEIKALTAGAARGTGYLTLAFNDDPDCNAPTMTSVIRVDCPLYRGEVKVIESTNPFEEKLTLRHNGDFGGGSDQRWFQWVYRRANFSGIPGSPPDFDEFDNLVLDVNVVTGGLWQPWSFVEPPPLAADPIYPPGSGIGEGNPWYRGAMDTVIQGSGEQLLPDRWFAARYFFNDVPPICADTVSRWTKPQLYEGWLKRVMKKINLFDQRITDFHSGEVNTLADMLSQAGRRYEGDAALSDDPDYIQHVGLIELYETLLRRARNLSIDGTPRSNQTDLNKAILFAANRLAGLYALLGNEAYADAADPTIGFSTEDGVYGTEAPSIFAFQNQADSLLEEELTLLRGRPDEGAQPFYNRLLWNFTIDDGEVAYRENYNITDQNGDGDIDEADAMILFPQGHGDAWGHYLMSLKKYYGLLTHDYFTWEPQSEAILVEQTPVSVDYRDERRFATVAAAKARAGSEIVTLAYRDYYEENPERQWQGYKDDDRGRAWGLADWASRAGQGAYIDWVVGNALLPPTSSDSVLQTGSRSCLAGTTTFVIDNPDYFRYSLRVIVNTVTQAPSLYTVSQQHDIVNNDWDTVVSFAASPCPAFDTTIAFEADVRPEGIQRIDRTRVTELQEIVTQYALIQATVDDADAGLNPLGVAKEAVPFDIDPARVALGETHFEQVYGRAVQSMNNAIAVFNHANQSSQLLRRQQDRLQEFQRNVVNAEADFTSRLIEIFGTPYPDDCGVGRTYSTAECNAVPDLYHFMYVDSTDLHAEMNQTLYVLPVTFTVQDIDASGALTVTDKPVLYHLAAAGTYGLRKPSSWYGLRKAPGEIQIAYAELLRARTKLQAEVNNYQDTIEQMEDNSRDLIRRWSKEDYQKTIRLTELLEQRDKDEFLRTGKEVLLGFRTASRLATFIADTVAEAVPKCIGLIAGVASGTVTDMLSGVRAAAKGVGDAVAEIAGIQGDIQDVVMSEIEAEKQVMRDERNLALEEEEQAYNREKDLRDFERTIRHEASRRDAVFVAIEEVQQAARRVQQVLARGERLVADRLRFRQQTAAQTQEYRYKDMTFRIFRNDALQKYKAQYELAARYVYLAAKAYDYETTLLDQNSMAGQNFLKNIVHQRSLGMIESGQPITGTGLADPMRRMWQNFQVLKPQLGFDNPQRETNRFSLRRELLRVGSTAGSGDTWRAALKSYRVEDIWQVPEFKRYCRPFGEEGVPEPGLVIPFRTTVTSGLNYFAWPLAGGDSYYSAANFATKVRSVGVWLSNYNSVGLAQTPRVYLVPVGNDVLRTPGAGVSDIRTWDVVDQKLPVPFPLNPLEMENAAGWIPAVDTLNDRLFETRRHSDFRAYHDSGYLDSSEMTYDTRLIGRSVWNTRWLLIVPGRSLLFDPDTGLDTFIDGPEVVGGTGERTGDGISDIKLFFETYAYSGN